MQCAICGKTTREIKNDMCLRCYVISRAIRLEPEMPYHKTEINTKLAAPQRDYARFNLKAFISDVRVDARNER